MLDDQKPWEQTVPDAASMEALGAAFAGACNTGLRVYLQGELGAGKTTFVRGFLRGLGHTGAVKSPTYAVVEHYDLGGREIIHLDLYRIADPDELEWIGLRDWLTDDTICLVEWWQRGEAFLPLPDVLISLESCGSGRKISARGETARGHTMLSGVMALTD